MYLTVTADWSVNVLDSDCRLEWCMFLTVTINYCFCYRLFFLFYCRIPNLKKLYIDNTQV